MSFHAFEDVQRRAASRASSPRRAPAIVHEVVRGPGRPLEPEARASLEPRFGFDFSGVRVHTDGRAAASARAVNALAYTAGNHVVFDEGRYQPSSPAGRRLLAHELTHVVQQHGASSTGGPLPLDDPAGAREGEAERASHAGSAVALTPGGVARSVQRQLPPEDRRRSEMGPYRETPLPARCNVIWDGRWWFQCEGLPHVKKTPKIPADLREIPGEIQKGLEKFRKGGQPPPAAGWSWPMPMDEGFVERWVAGVCDREPHSILCRVPGGTVEAEQPELSPPLPWPVGVFWTTGIHFEHDRPSVGGEGAEGTEAGITPEGARALDTIVFLLQGDPTLRVRLIGHASSEGTAQHNLALSTRRAEAVRQRLDAAGVSWQVTDPVESDGLNEGCDRLEIGMWACGAAQAADGEIRPEDRQVSATLLRNPPLPRGPMTLEPPQLLRGRSEGREP